MPKEPPISADGLWYWDGSAWVSLVSPDLTRHWDRKAWVPVVMNPSATQASPSPAAAANDRPSWLPADVAMPVTASPANSGPVAVADPPAVAPAIPLASGNMAYAPASPGGRSTRKVWWIGGGVAVVAVILL